MRGPLAGVASAALGWLVACAPDAPYPPSDQIAAVRWDFASLRREAAGSDLWPTTWAADDHLYATWGDGGGFGGDDRRARVSLGVARIEGDAMSWRGANVVGGVDAEAPSRFEGKASLLALDGALWLFVTEQDRWLRAKIGRSLDGGHSWHFGGGPFERSAWDFAEPGGAFAAPAILQFGRDYAGARDAFVYLYSERRREDSGNRELLLARVPRGQLGERAAYEFFAGLGPQGAPRWTEDLARARAVFRDPRGVGWGIHAAYHPGLGRYWLTTRRPDAAGGREGAWGWFDAPEPWGPWTTVADYTDWDAGTPLAGTERQIGYGFPTKWMDSRETVWMAASLDDSLVVIRARLTLREGR